MRQLFLIDLKTKSQKMELPQNSSIFVYYALFSMTLDGHFAAHLPQPMHFV